MWAWLLGSNEPAYDVDALRAYYLLHVCDGFSGVLPSEDDFMLWLDNLDATDVDFCQDMGTCALERLAGGDDSGDDVFDTLALTELRPVWQTYQRANQSWGALTWAARVTAWAHGVPWW